MVSTLSTVHFIRKPNTAKTTHGIGIGNVRKSVEKEFGLAEEIKNGGKEHWYWKKGFQIDYDDVLKVEKFYIFKPIGAAPAGVANAIQQQQALRNKAALEKYYTED